MESREGASRAAGATGALKEAARMVVLVGAAARTAARGTQAHAEASPAAVRKAAERREGELVAWMAEFEVALVEGAAERPEAAGAWHRAC